MRLAEGAFLLLGAFRPREDADAFAPAGSVAFAVDCRVREVLDLLPDFAAEAFRCAGMWLSFASCRGFEEVAFFASDMPAEIVSDAATPIPVPCLDVSLTLDAVYRRGALPAVYEPESGEYALADDDGSALVVPRSSPSRGRRFIFRNVQSGVMVMSRKPRRRTSVEPARERAGTTGESLGDDRFSLHLLTGELHDLFEAIVCGSALTASVRLPPEVLNAVTDDLPASSDELANALFGDAGVDDDTPELGDLDDDELDPALEREAGALGAALGGVALTTRMLAQTLIARVLGRDERPPVAAYYVPDPTGAQRAESERAIDDLARALLPPNLPDGIRPSRSELKSAVAEAAYLVREVGLEAFDVSCYIETTPDGDHELFVYDRSPEAAHISLLEFLFERAENVASNLDPLLLVERNASAWEFSRWSASPPPGMGSLEEQEFARQVREHEYGLVEYRSVALGRSVIADLADDDGFAELFPRQHRMAGALASSFVDVLRCDALTGVHATFRSLRSGRTYHVHEHMDPIEYEVGWIAAGRLIPFESQVHLRSPGTIFFRVEDPEFLAGAIGSIDSAHGSLPPALALEAFISSAVFDVSVPRDVKPARSRAAARDLLAEVEALLGDIAEDDPEFRPGATLERYMVALGEQGKAGRAEETPQRARKRTRRR